jgi:hypothetical protein
MIRENSSLHLPFSYNEPVSMDYDGQLIAIMARKKNKVMKLVSSIAKTGYNDDCDYNYVEEAEVSRAIRGALVKVGLSFSVSTSEILPPNIINTEFGEEYNYTIKMTFTLVDTETGYCQSSPWLGMGSDQGDKALYKAYTSGVKYFLLKNFLLPTDDDVERSSIIPKKTSKVSLVAPPSERPPMGPNSIQIMESLADHYRKQLPQGSRFDQERFQEAVWEHFNAWPCVNAAAKRIKEAIDVREVVVFERSTK